MSSELFPEVGVLILASRILVGGGVLNMTEGSLVSFLAPGGACSHESHVLTCQHGRSERRIAGCGRSAPSQAVGFSKLLFWNCDGWIGCRKTLVSRVLPVLQLSVVKDGNPDGAKSGCQLPAEAGKAGLWLTRAFTRDPPACQVLWPLLFWVQHTSGGCVRLETLLWDI